MFPLALQRKLRAQYAQTTELQEQPDQLHAVSATAAPVSTTNAEPAPFPPATATLTSNETTKTLKCSQGFHYGEYAGYWAAHELYGHVGDAQLKVTLKDKTIEGAT